MNRRLGLLGIGSAITTLLSGCSGAQLLDHLVVHDTYHGTTGVPYGDDPRQLLDVYQPYTGTAPGNPPVVLFFYGGSWTRGERAQYRFVGEQRIKISLGARSPVEYRRALGIAA